MHTIAKENYFNTVVDRNRNWLKELWKSLNSLLLGTEAEMPESAIWESMKQTAEIDSKQVQYAYLDRVSGVR